MVLATNRAAGQIIRAADVNGIAAAVNAVEGAVLPTDSRLSDARTPLAHTQAASTISDSTPTGRSLMTAADAAAARTTIGAGTSNLALGTTSSTAKAGNYAPPTATSTTSGIVELATTTEATAGADTARAVTPAGVAAVAATKVDRGGTGPVRIFPPAVDFPAGYTPADGDVFYLLPPVV